MRVLIVRPGPAFSVQDVAFGWRDGLVEAGATVVDYNHDDRLDFYSSAEIDDGDGNYHVAFTREQALQVAAKGILASCYEFWPDIVVVVSGFFIPPPLLNVIRSRGTKVVWVFTESPYEDDGQLDRAGYADLVLLNDPTNLEKFQEVTDAHYIPHAYNPHRHHPGPADPNMACDFAFVGTGFPSRREFLERVDWDGLDVVLAGSWAGIPDDSPLRALIAHRLDHCLDNEDTAKLYRSTKSSINLYRQEHTDGDHSHAEGWAMGPREVELAACGTWFMRDARPEGDELFPMLPIVNEPGEVRPLIDWALAHDLEREEAALKARAAIADRTFENNARWLLNRFDK